MYDVHRSTATRTMLIFALVTCVDNAGAQQTAPETFHSADLSPELYQNLIENDRQIEIGLVGRSPLSLFIELPQRLSVADADRYCRWLGVDEAACLQWVHEHFVTHQQRMLLLQEQLLPELHALSSEIAEGFQRGEARAALAERRHRLYQSYAEPYDQRTRSIEEEIIAALWQLVPEADRSNLMMGMIEADRQRVRYAFRDATMPWADVDYCQLLDRIGVDWMARGELRAILSRYILELGPLRQSRFREGQRMKMNSDMPYIELERNPDFAFETARRNQMRPFAQAHKRLIAMNRRYLTEIVTALNTSEGKELDRLVRELAYPQIYGESRALGADGVTVRVDLFTRQMREMAFADQGQREVVLQLLDEFHVWYDAQRRRMEQHVSEYHERLFETLTARQSDIIAYEARLDLMRAEIHQRFQRLTEEVQAYLTEVD